MTTETDPLSTALDSAVTSMNNAAALIETLLGKPTVGPDELAATLNNATSKLNSVIAAATIEPSIGATVDGGTVGKAEFAPAPETEPDPTQPTIGLAAV